MYNVQHTFDFLLYDEDSLFSLSVWFHTNWNIILFCQVVMTAIPQHPFGLALYEDYLYWTDWLLHAVVRVNKYDSSDYTYLEQNLHRQPMGIAVFAEDANDCKFVSQSWRISYTLDCI